MTAFVCRSVNRHPVRHLCLILMLAIFCQPLICPAAESERQKIETTLQDSLTDLWTGRQFSPGLSRRQQTLKNMLATEAIDKTELAKMLEKMTVSLLNREKTSRYVLKKMPERFDEVLSPYLSWPDMRQVIWRAMSSAVDNDNPLKITVGTLAPPGTPWLSVPENSVIADIKQLSRGKIQIQIYGSGVMGEDPDVLKKMKADQLDGCGCTALGVLAACPEASVLLLPGLFRNYEEVDYICENFRKRLDKAFEQRGYILAALIDTGFFNFFLKNYVADLDGLRNQKVQTWFGTLETAFYKELGIIPVPVKSPETVSALSSGRFDATLSPAAWMLGMQAYQYVHYYLTPPLLYSPAAVITGVDLKSRIRAHMGVSDVFAQNLQEILVSEFNALEPEWKHQIRTYEAKSLKAFETKCGMQALTFSPDDMAQIEKAGRAVERKLAGNVFSKDLLDDIHKALSDFRKADNP